MNVFGPIPLLCLDTYSANIFFRILLLLSLQCVFRRFIFMRDARNQTKVRVFRREKGRFSSNFNFIFSLVSRRWWKTFVGFCSSLANVKSVTEHWLNHIMRRPSRDFLVAHTNPPGWLLLHQYKLMGGSSRTSNGGQRNFLGFRSTFDLQIAKKIHSLRTWGAWEKKYRKSGRNIETKIIYSLRVFQIGDAAFRRSWCILHSQYETSSNSFTMMEYTFSDIIQTEYQYQRQKIKIAQCALESSLLFQTDNQKIVNTLM